MDLKTFYALLTLTFIVTTEQVNSYRCIHKYPKLSEVDFIKLEKQKVHKRQDLQKFRIKVFYDNSLDALRTEERFTIKDVISKAVSYWSEALLVNPFPGPIRLSSGIVVLNLTMPDGQVVQKVACLDPPCQLVPTCGEAIVPKEHLGRKSICTGEALDNSGRRFGRIKCQTLADSNGVSEADFLLYVSARQSERCKAPGTAAYSQHCAQEADQGRPVAGFANVCPEFLKYQKKDANSLLTTVKHEILHAIGFSISLFAFYVDKDGKRMSPTDANGQPLQRKITPYFGVGQWGENIMKTVKRQWKSRNGIETREVNVIVTPTVVKEVQDHFGCPDLEGAEVEDQGGEGTSWTHWEKRILEDEAMTGVYTQEAGLSRITFALLEDTGWYVANYNMAKPLTWGKSLGCQFATQSCKEWMDKKRDTGQSLHPFCDQVKGRGAEPSCSRNKEAVVACNLKQYPKPLPEQFQYFDNLPGISSTKVDRFGGAVELADFCPYIQEFKWKSPRGERGSRCDNKENNPSKNYLLEFYGQDSKCFEFGQHWSSADCGFLENSNAILIGQASGCYKYSCKEGRLRIEIENRTFPCHYDGQEILIQVVRGNSIHSGTILCPSCNQYCKDQCKPDSVSEGQSQTYDKEYCPSNGLYVLIIVLVVVLIIAIIVLAVAMYFYFKK